MPRINVEWLAIRSEEQRRALAERITQAVMDTAGVEADAVTVVFHEIDPELQAKGGVFWSERLAAKTGR